ncbi:hypothetical protein PFICI_13056 [Pestalotiopsis fici W106-1]|uniref:Uncharacterized protein n=1 Tax=Pestalotiopsis fici (strain W106-1 / CGMCC3.15140) TaxID=1229662 RepID=W3WN27_PESFW|nr:uncharacterized protein PFICI_13056 [Pestalotiopsis fici W106-1]ETS74572.1 hypothetical protein PFICI_13056 [Pestalotiopsis fici W106-1]
MESWTNEENLVLSSNQSLWVQLMNQSTSEWSLGPFPSNVYAINTTYDATYAARFPNGALVIEKAGVAKIGDTAVEALIFGLVSAAAILWAFWWLWKEFKDGTWKSPPPRDIGRSQRPVRLDEGIALSTTRNDTRDNNGSRLQFPTAEEFKTALLSKYYESGISELEVLDQVTGADGNDLGRASVTSEEIETVQELLRKLYGFESEIIGQSHAQHPDNLHDLRKRSDAALVAIQRIVDGWKAGANEWDQNELGHLRDIVRALNEVTRRGG